MASKEKQDKQDKLKLITTIAEKRGFFYPTAEIYGGKAGFYTYGSLGKAMKNKFENLWRAYFLSNENFHEIEGNSILPHEVFVASGHIKSFNDPLVECKSCHFRFRADQFLEDTLKMQAEGMSTAAMTKLIKNKKLKCPKCNSEKLTNVEWFNMMFPIHLGAAGKQELAYLSPETAQNPYLAFKREFEVLRRQLPLGLAMIGKAFRNEISPRQLFFRLREFTQAELQIFFDPDEIENVDKEKWREVVSYKLLLFPAKEKKLIQMTCGEANNRLRLPKLYLYHLARIQKFYLESLGVPREKFRFRELGEEERAFYNKLHWDIELELETLGGFKEVAGLHYRGSHDLGSHAKHSRENLEVFVNNKKFVPHVLEVSFGVDRNIFAFLDLFFRQEKERTLFAFPPKLAPIEVAIFPLVAKDKLPEKAKEVYNLLKKDFTCFYDENDSIGKRYRRVDEIGVPLAITIDYDSLKKNDVTIRARDDMKQKRVKIAEVKEAMRKL